ncbi:response regulator [Cohnella endophytica]|uniref:Response regulator n=1 Tax=Cohnella endophytica TaxID=2419778 RepID=A0A494Y5I1_9BACL|nr:response regulator [Cohnella endophytica]RKP57330.1 response regulator [Cohnella endophytica]
MIKVLIADDEPVFRDYLYHLVDWGEHGFEICGQARNGEEALELADSLRPQIALLDINMPIMDGIRVAEQLKMKYPEMMIALVTGYGEFEYARKAIRLGVEDYVLKPFKKEEMLSTLLKFKFILQKKQEETARAKDDSFYAQERLLNALLEGEFEAKEEEFVRHFQGQGTLLNEQYYSVASIDIDHLYQLWTKHREISLWKFAVANVMGDILQDKSDKWIFNGPEGRIVCIQRFNRADEAEEFDHSSYATLCDYVAKYFRFTVSVGVSRIVHRLAEIRDAYSESAIALQNKLILGNGRVIEYGAIMESNKGSGFYPMILNEQLLSALRRHEHDEAHQALYRMKAHIQSHQLPVDFTYAIIMSVVSMCLSYITEMGGNIETILGDDFRPYQQIKKIASLDESFQWLSQLFGQTISHYREQKVSRVQKIARNVQEFIEEHYVDSELSVENIAKHLHLDSSYIRKVFSKEFNMNIAEFITQVRMKQAKLLMDTDNMKMQELSERVGYSDAGYFSKVFKKYCGILPSEYVAKKVKH